MSFQEKGKGQQKGREGGNNRGSECIKRERETEFFFSQGRVLMRERLGVRLRKARRDVRLSWPNRLVCVVAGGPPKDGSWGSYTLCVFSNTPLAVLGPQGLSVLCVHVCVSEPGMQPGVGRTLQNPSPTAGDAEETLRRRGRSTSER